MTLSLLESRMKDSVPSKYHKEIEREIAKFGSEIQRMSGDSDKIGQATLTEREIRLAPTGNQHSESGFTTIELQCIKAAALKYQVDDWLHEIDKQLTYEENITNFKKKGEERKMREIEHYR